MYGQFGANAYSRVGVQTSVVDASPHRLIVLLYEGARKALAKARVAVQMNDVALKGQSITNAIGIIGSGLQDALDLIAGKPGRCMEGHRPRCRATAYRRGSLAT